MKNFTDIFIKRPVLATVISAFIFVLGIRSIGSLSIQQYPTVESAVITISTSFTGADPATIAAFITTPLENAIAQANGIDYLASNSTQNTSMIQANLLLNYDPDKSLTEVNTQVNTVLNQLPSGSQMPVITITPGQSIDSMYLGFYSDELDQSKINDYLLRVVQPKLQSVSGVQQAQILGNNQFALRVWINPKKLAGYHLSPAQIGQILRDNDFVSAAGRTDGQTFTLNFSANTSLTSVDDFKNMVIKSENGAIIRLKDIATITLGAQNYNTTVTFKQKQAVYIGITVTPNANLLTVLNQVRATFQQMQAQLPRGLNGAIVYDASSFVTTSIHEVITALIEAFLIVTVVVFLFLGSFRALFIPVIAIPLSIIGTFFMMLLLGYSINLLTLLALVLAIGLVVDDAIIVVENVYRHMEAGTPALKASLLSARELTSPIIAITIVLIAVYLPIGFMGGLTGSLFTEFAFTLAGSVAVSAVIALTLSPMMCSKMLTHISEDQKFKVIKVFDNYFNGIHKRYNTTLDHALNFLPVVIVFAVLILTSNAFLFTSSQSELAPQEDQGIVMNQLFTAANSSLSETGRYSSAVSQIYATFPEMLTSFQINGTGGSTNAPMLNNNIGGIVLNPWDERKRTSNQLQPILQKDVNKIAGAKIAMFQLPSLPGGGSGLPIQFVVETTDSFESLNEIAQTIIKQAYQSGKFVYLDPDLKLDKEQTIIDIDRNKVSEFGLTMQDIGNSLSSALSENYINYFNYMGRSYQVIPQVMRQTRLNDDDILNYYINTSNTNTKSSTGASEDTTDTSNARSVPLSTFIKLKHVIVPQAINHFQQLNSVTISGVAAPGVSMGQALGILQKIATDTLPQGYNVDYASQSRQFVKESSALVMTFVLAMIIIFLSLSVLFNSFRDPLIVLISVPMSICGAMIFICLGVKGATLNIYTEVGLVTLIGLISKHGILIVQFANDLQLAGKSKREAAITAANVRFRPIVMTTAAMVLGVIP